jgi:hypothetical protein
MEEISQQRPTEDQTFLPMSKKPVLEHLSSC